MAPHPSIAPSSGTRRTEARRRLPAAPRLRRRGSPAAEQCGTKQGLGRAPSRCRRSTELIFFPFFKLHAWRCPAFGERTKAHGRVPGVAADLWRPGAGSARLAAGRAAPGGTGTRRRSPAPRASLGSQLEPPRASPRPREEKSPPMKSRRRPEPARDGFIHFPDVLMVSLLFAGR